MNLNGGAAFFFKHFRIYIASFVNSSKDFQIKAQLLTEKNFKKLGPTTICFGFKLKLKALGFFALNNCFRKIFWTSYALLSFVIPFVVQ